MIGVGAFCRSQDTSKTITYRGCMDTHTDTVRQLPDGRWLARYRINGDWWETTADTEAAAWDEIMDWNVLAQSRYVRVAQRVA